MMANCLRWSGVTSTLAPLSQIPTMPPFMVGRIGQKAGRITPFTRPIRVRAAATKAPVEPVLTMALMSSRSRNNRTALIMELSRFRRITSMGRSSHPMTSGAWTTSTLSAS